MRGIVLLAALAACGGSPAPDHAPAHEPGGHDHHPIGHRFEKAEDWVPVFEGEDRDRWQKPDEVVSLLAIEPGMTVADIGAGTGYFLPRLSEAVGDQGRVLGLDIEPDMVRYMNERAAKQGLANVEARVVEVDDPKLPAASVDRILIVDTWHHIPDRADYAKKLAASLRDGGTVSIVDFTMESTHGPPKAHRLTAEAVIAELKAGGLEAEAIAESLPEQYVVVGR